MTAFSMPYITGKNICQKDNPDGKHLYLRDKEKVRQTDSSARVFSPSTIQNKKIFLDKKKGSIYITNEYGYHYH